MRHLEESRDEYFSDYTLCISYLLIAFSLLYLSTILLVISFGWYNISPEEILTGLNYKFQGLLGWPKYLIAYITFVWTLLCISRMEYPLSRAGTYLKNVAYFISLYVMTVGIVQLLIKFVQYQIMAF